MIDTRLCLRVVISAASAVSEATSSFGAGAFLDDDEEPGTGSAGAGSDGFRVSTVGASSSSSSRDIFFFEDLAMEADHAALDWPGIFVANLAWRAKA